MCSFTYEMKTVAQVLRRTASPHQCGVVAQVLACGCAVFKKRSTSRKPVMPVFRLRLGVSGDSRYDSMASPMVIKCRCSGGVFAILRQTNTKHKHFKTLNPHTIAMSDTLK